MLNTHIASLTVTPALVKGAAADTTAATSGWIDVRGYEGQVGVVLTNGVVTTEATVAFTFETATTSEGGGNDEVEPINAEDLAIASEAAEPFAQIAVFNTVQLKGYLKVIGSVSAGEAVAAELGYAVIGMKKYTT